ncbi:tyrosine-type recombinase/integrase [Aromatoleum anaerobium]|uniref:Tyrosine-type recombinase/integrase n=2 Tax=Aromatoleum TaxID=551759 RepID=A0ABX1PRL3_9RHOO|nr:tyrosine-type recombinase/integrase [Aromatoleum anaerobium]MCK0505433.1 tyrosine-type recombinase/integrase [Aromatoleum anaerobium]MCK0507993.1 tyrosine-type recombinase/integrase [Aromatoleum anaerobium]MCK0508445.1 tyrosine-type recombinase/integrase [Aromatoleum anaerobium]MCK0509127.1 tyrosine-type recombinase/integrase [Aromatoleum anaerobium]
MNAPVSWMTRVETYLAYRRRHGFELSIDATQLRSFARFADRCGTADHLTVALASAWARSSQRPNPLTWARRIDVLRGFARFCLRDDPATEMPPRGLFGPAHRRLVPHIYTEAELIALLDAANGLAPEHGLRPATCRCIFGLLAASGLRISEALGLTRADVDLEAGILRIREAKFHRQRLVPLHLTVTEYLDAYALQRDRLVPRPACDRFFLRDDGHCANRRDILYALQALCQQLGWQPRGDYPHHRLHDMRHTFIVRSTLRFYEQGIDVDRAVLALSTYVGHAKVSDTYWYFTGIPELMAIAAERFHRYTEGATR